ncbi:uncharacterized protein A4U43_C04F21110 [Asparagus officinalis]|uniref:Uncharacterized protein n=1 Tax=Asparagus officinalis TaxID=4686 RepID=A0A5P1F369_ASPOF|nr:uncharacterized protein A4U43_C04F21110 [Asparagus officinalis]
MTIRASLITNGTTNDLRHLPQRKTLSRIISRGRSKLRSSRDDELQGMTSFEGGVGDGRSRRRDSRDDELRGTSERPASRENSENPSPRINLESDLKEEREESLFGVRSEGGG